MYVRLSCDVPQAPVSQRITQIHSCTTPAQFVRVNQWSSLGNEIKKKNKTFKSHWTPPALTALSRQRKHSSAKVHVHYRRWIWTYKLHHESLWLVGKEDEQAYQTYPDNHCWYDTRRVLHFWPWYAGSLFGQTAAVGCVSVCVCVWWVVVVVGGAVKKRKKKAKPQNISVTGPVS